MNCNCWPADLYPGWAYKETPSFSTNWIVVIRKQWMIWTSFGINQVENSPNLTNSGLWKILWWSTDPGRRWTRFVGVNSRTITNSGHNFKVHFKLITLWVGRITPCSIQPTGEGSEQLISASTTLWFPIISKVDVATSRIGTYPEIKGVLLRLCTRICNKLTGGSPSPELV